MDIENLKVGLAITGSFCNFSEIEGIIHDLKEAGIKEIVPIVSYVTKDLDTRFAKSKDFIEMLEKETGRKIIDTIVKAEPVGPKNLVDIILICPCTGNTLAKLANGITDTPVLMAIKGHIRNNKPVVIAISTNDGLGFNLENIGKLLNAKLFYFVPFRQDNYVTKPKSLVFEQKDIIDTIKSALNNEQIQPLLLS